MAYANILAVINPHNANIGLNMYANMIFCIKFVQNVVHLTHMNGYMFNASIWFNLNFELLTNTYPIIKLSNINRSNVINSNKLGINIIIIQVFSYIQVFPYHQQQTSSSCLYFRLFWIQLYPLSQIICYMTHDYSLIST